MNDNKSITPVLYNIDTLNSMDKNQLINYIMFLANENKKRKKIKKEYIINPISKRKITIGGSKFFQLIKSGDIKPHNIPFDKLSIKDLLRFHKINSSQQTTERNKQIKLMKIMDVKMKMMDDIMKMEKISEKLNENIKHKVVEFMKLSNQVEKSLSVKPLYWELNLPWEDPLEIEKINNLVQEEREKHEDSYSKYFQMVFDNNIHSYEDIINSIMKRHDGIKEMYRLLFSFGLILEIPILDDKGKFSYQFRLFKPGKDYFLEDNVIVKNMKDLRSKVLSKIKPENELIYKLKKFKPNSRSRLIGVYAIGYKITLLGYPIGAMIELPEYIK